MALYQDTATVQQTTHEAFDAKHKPGAATPFSGVYRCETCGDEIASNKGNPLPPQNHAQHSGDKPIVWKLQVYAQQKK